MCWITLILNLKPPFKALCILISHTDKQGLLQFKAKEIDQSLYNSMFTCLHSMPFMLLFSLTMILWVEIGDTNSQLHTRNQGAMMI